MNLNLTRRCLLFAGTTAGTAALRPLLAPGQESTGATQKTAKKYQAKAPKTQPFGAGAFAASSRTTIRWLGAAGFFINSRGTTLMIDPLLEGFDMPIMIDMPIMPKQVPHLDAVLITHSDTGHYSRATCRDLKPVCHSFDSTKYVATVMQKRRRCGNRVPRYACETSGVGPCAPIGPHSGIPTWLGRFVGAV